GPLGRSSHQQVSLGLPRDAREQARLDDATIGGVYVVAICKLVSSIEDEAEALARNLGSTAYEERLNLVAGLPAIVLMTVDREKASALLGKLRARGQGAIAFDANNVTPIDRMVRPKMFTIGFDELSTRDATGLAPAPGQMGGAMDPSATRGLP